MSNFWDELKRRNVIRETLAYLAVAWVLLQVADIVLETFDAPDWISQTLVIILAAGLPVWVLLSWAYKITLRGFERVSGPVQKESRGARRNLLIMFVFATLAAVVLVWAFRGIGFKIREDAQYAVAILPLRDLGQNDIDWFCHGLASDIRNKISRVKNLSPTSMRSASLYQDSDKLITEIAKELDVSYLLDGEVRMNGNLYLIDLELLNEDGEVVWKDQYMVPKGEHYQVSQNVIDKIIESLEVNVTKEEFGYFSREGTQDEKAWESFARGEKIINGLHEQDDYRKAAEHFKEAIRLDPEFAEAYAGLAVCQIYDFYWGVYFPADSNTSLLEKAFKNAEKALQIDSTSVLSNAVLGNYYWNVREDNTKAHQLYNKAIELDPNNSYVLWDYAWRISTTPNGDMDQALALINKAYQLDPFASKVIWMKERIMWQSRDLEGFEEYMKSQTDSSFSHPIKVLEGNLEVLRHRDERARISYFLDKIKMDSLNPQLYWDLAGTYGVLNRHDKWLECIKKVLELVTEDQDRNLVINEIKGQLYELGYFEMALELLDIDDSELRDKDRSPPGWLYYYYKGDYEQALHILLNEDKGEGLWPSYRKCLVLARLGRKDEVHEIIKRIHNDDKVFWDPRPLLRIYAALEERDSMYYYFNHPINIHFGAGHNGNTIFDPYRKEPRYREWLRKTYLPQPEDTVVPE